jgi:hypothetical protein
MYMEDLEEKAMSTFHVKPHIILLYVDDMFYEWPEDICPVTDFFDHLNQQSPHIKFTTETEKDGILPFLDVNVIKYNGEITIEVYRKKNDFGLYLKYDSSHPKPVKNGILRIVNTLLHRAETHSTLNVAKARDVEFVKKTLVRNKYPERLMENIENKRKNE